MNDKKQFADHFMLTCLAYEKEFKPELAKLYFADLQEFDDSTIAAAFNAHRKDPDRGRFFPKVADIIYQIRKTDQRTDVRQLAELEWSKVLHAAARGIKPKECRPETTGALQLAGGVKAVGYAEPADLARIKKHFVDSFVTLAECKPCEVPEHIESAVQLIQQKQQVIIRG
jgi:hypothetical protein